MSNKTNSENLAHTHENVENNDCENGHDGVE